MKASGKSAEKFADNISNYAYMAILYRIKIPNMRGMKINDQSKCRKKVAPKTAVTSITSTFSLRRKFKTANIKEITIG